MNYIWISLLALSLLGTATTAVYAKWLKRTVEYYRNLIVNLTSGTLFSESLSTIATAYDLTEDELMTIIETYQNTTGKRK